VNLGFATLLKDYQGGRHSSCDAPGFSRSNGTIHGIVGQFGCRE